MRKSDLTYLISSPEESSKKHIENLQEVISEYPYFTSAQLLLTKAFYESENLNFEKQLRLSAAYSSDRKRLHDLIHSGPIAKETIAEEQAPAIEESTASQEEISKEDAFLESQILTSAINSSILQEVGYDEEGIETAAQEIAEQAVEEAPAVQSFDEEVGHSFSDWMRHFSGEEIVEERKNPKSDAIKAISDQARTIQKKAEFYSASKMAKLSVIESDDLVTETLAQVYEAQGKYERAIQAYQKLQLKFPEKRVYFAGRIKAVEEKLKS